MRKYQEPVFEITHLKDKDVVTLSDALAGNDNVVGALAGWGDDWKGTEVIQ